MTTLLFSGCALLIRKAPARPERPPQSSEEKIPTFRGVYHVHSSFSHDSKASLATVIETAKKAGLDFVIVTDHNTLQGKHVYEGCFPSPLASPHKWGEGSLPARRTEVGPAGQAGVRGACREILDAIVMQNGRPTPLLIFGEEISTPDGHMIAVGIDREPPKNLSSQELVDWIHREGGFAGLAHPVEKKNPWRNWNLQNFDGMEIYNFSHAFYGKNIFKLAAQLLFLQPDHFLDSFQERPVDSLKLWDEKLKDRPLLGFGAVDAHIHVRFLGFAPENYLLAFESVTTYVDSDELSPASILQSLKEGKGFTALEARGEARGFLFEQKGKTLEVRTPLEAEIKLLHGGRPVELAHGKSLIFHAREPGVYRVEVYRDGKIWILSNAIRVE